MESKTRSTERGLVQKQRDGLWRDLACALRNLRSTCRGGQCTCSRACRPTWAYFGHTSPCPVRVLKRDSDSDTNAHEAEAVRVSLGQRPAEEPLVTLRVVGLVRRRT